MGKGRGKGGFPWAENSEGRIGFCVTSIVLMCVLVFAMGLGFGLTCANNNAACNPKNNVRCRGEGCANKRTEDVTAMLYLYDSASDGWEGNMWTIANAQLQDIATGTLQRERYGIQYLALEAGTYAITTSGENYPDENRWRFEDYLTGDVVVGKVPSTTYLHLGDFSQPCSRGTVAQGGGGLPPCEYCGLGKYAPGNDSASSGGSTGSGDAPTPPALRRCERCPASYAMRGARAPSDGIEFTSGTYLACAVLAGTFVLAWIVLSSANRLAYDAADVEDKDGFGDHAHDWERTCGGNVAGWTCALLCMVAGLACLAIWSAPAQNTLSSMVRDGAGSCGESNALEVFAAGLTLVGLALLWLVFSWYAIPLVACWRPAVRKAVTSQLRLELENAHLARQESRLMHADNDIEMFMCSLCQTRRADALNRPCDHCFLCFECCERFRAEAGDICNGCREESSIERVRFVNDRTTERHMLAAAAAVEDETLLESQPTPRSLNLDALTQAIARVRLTREMSHIRTLSTLCAVCAKVRIDAVNEPCGHSTMCIECATKYVADNGMVCSECASPAVLRRISTVKTCDICFDEVDASHLYTAGLCGHMLCVTCSVDYVRSALGNVKDEVFARGLRCPMHHSSCDRMLEPANLRTLVSKQVRKENRAEHAPLVQSEYDRLERFVIEAGIPPDQRFYCTNEACARMYAVDFDEVRKRVKPKVDCPYCLVSSCVNCKIRWHDALSCDEVNTMGKDAALDVGFINITSKACPQCGFRITHYHGHACHHIRPGSGCLNCGTHFCYRCLRRGHSGNDCGCRLFCQNDDILTNIVLACRALFYPRLPSGRCHDCTWGGDVKVCIIQLPYPHDSRCGCPLCPDCKPGRPCAQCDGGCVVCRSTVAPGPMQPEDIPTWKAVATAGDA